MKLIKVSIILLLGLFISIMPVSASKSIKRQGDVISAFVNGKKLTGDRLILSNFYVNVGNESSTIKDINASLALSKVFANKKINNTTGHALSDFKLLSRLQEIRSEKGKQYTNFTITWEVNNLMSKDVYLLVYDEVTKTWSIKKPDKVDLKNKTITATFAHMSVVGVLYLTNNVSTNRSARTGDDTEIFTYTILGSLSLLVVIAILIFKKQNEL